MITVIIYISRSGKLPEKCRYFFTYKEEMEEVWILECQKSERHIWREKESAEIYQRVVDKVADYKEWKLLVVDDRRKCVERTEMYNDSWFLWEVVDILSREAGYKEYAVTLPASVTVISTVKGTSAQAEMERKEVCSEHIVEKKYESVPRLFLYDFEGDRAKREEELEVIFYLIMFYFSGEDICFEYYAPSIVYKIKTEWNWKAFYQYAGQMECQYQRRETKIEEQIRDMSQSYQSFASRESETELFMPHRRKKSSRKWERLEDKENELNDIHRRILEEAKNQFEEIRSIYSGRKVDWNSDISMEEIRRRRDKYETELDDMYRNGIWNFEEIKKRIGEIKEIRGREKKRKKIIPEFIIVLIMCNCICGLSKTVCGSVATVLLIISAIIVAAFCVVYALSGAEGSGSVKEKEWKRVILDIERGERRIKEEISCMANYMKVCQQQYETERKERDRKRNLEEVMEERKKLIRCRRILNQIFDMGKVSSTQEELSEGLDTAWQMQGEDLYYPTGWRNKHSLEVAQNEKISFPFPFIQSIKIDKL